MKFHKFKISRAAVLFFVVLEISCAPVIAKTWSLEKTPKEFRPQMCDMFRRSIIQDRSTQSYKWAKQREAAGTMWNESKQHLAFSKNLVNSMKRLGCGKIP
jgi:hypothetical protein